MSSDEEEFRNKNKNMASFSSFLYSSSLKDDLSCPVCKEIFDDSHTPIDLNCPHTCCQSCIQHIAGGRNIAECPECRKVTPIPRGGVKMMTVNLRLRNIAKRFVGYMRNREVMPPKCGKHPLERMYCYCPRCNETVCHVCVTLRHKECNIKELKEMHEIQTKEVAAVLEETDQEARLCIENAESLEKLSEDIETSLSAENEKINQEEKAMIEKIRHEAQAKRNQLQETEEPRLRELHDNVARLRQHADNVQENNRKVETVLEETADHEYVTQHNGLVAGLKSMLGEDKGDGIDRQVNKAKFVFKSMQQEVSLGEVVKHNVLHKVDEFGKFDSLVSIAETPEGRIVLLDKDNKNKKMHVYEKVRTGKYVESQTNIVLDSSNRNAPCGVAVRSDEKILVARVSHIEIYSSQDGLENSVKVASGNAHTIKVLPDDKVLITDTDNCTITILLQDLSQKVRSFKIAITPRCVAILPNSHIAITDFQSSYILEINYTTGDVEEKYKVSNALGLCYQEGTDCLLVGRSTKLLSNRSGPLFGHGEILQYCRKTGALVGKIVQEKLDCSWDMVVLEDGRLAVADLWAAKIYARN